MATGFEAAGLALALFPFVLEGIAIYQSSAERVAEIIRHKRTLTKFRRDLETEKAIFENTWYKLRIRAGVLVEPNVTESYGPEYNVQRSSRLVRAVYGPEIVKAVLSCLPPHTADSFLDGCQELTTILTELSERLDKYNQDMVAMITFT